ncbi:PaaX family transcriptional regulator C-terminal domain-containing protein [Methylobacterium nodulans]|uniref:Transcriptional regulator, PaaX family n=1 Tax=Methylobacterium nodulans (strain LMG 21967 / CNCM I-2342 / ORS 2060) TaxID=460265 RepID=B8IM94_METNO|nr:PaaX family transcriptional regulator C-terminal domain-containing protein [Methylobacterium nodulans]ACL58280.1 transcriptional regulator, PaaX family [Methylobacterium nodulans ORS 2060]
MSKARRTLSDSSGGALLSRLIEKVPLRSGSFIVTLYGDVVEPRGGRLWMGNIVDTCEAVGISETLVRTAVSRLVSAGQLTGERQGRRSFYRLTEAARREFLSAARILFEPHDETGWRFVWLDPDRSGEGGPMLEQAGYVRLGPQWFLGPAHQALSDPSLAIFEGTTAAAGPVLRRLAAAHWDIASFNAAYDAFLAAFAPVSEALAKGVRPSDAQALHLRLLLVHTYRLAALRDARLPAETLPPDWSGHRARRLFADLYLRLSPGADRHVGHHLLSGESTLPAESPEVSRRLTALARVLDGA